MRALVVGGGSIGRRHLQNLQALGIESLGLVEPDESRHVPVARCFTELGPGLDWAPSLVVIASPTHLHAPQALEVVDRRIPIFIEKPLTHSEDGLHRLVSEVAAQRLVTMVACNMRFHPGPARVKQLLEEGAIGEPYFARIHMGSYLPGWRPGRDYRSTYSAHAEMGGGVLLDSIHEVDLARWYLGDVTDVFCRATRVSGLDMNVEGIALLILRHVSGVSSEVHLDYVQRTYERGSQIVGENGSVFWDFREGKVRWFDASRDAWETLAQPEGWELNQMYVDEMRHFVECVRHSKPSCHPVEEAARVTRVVFAAKESTKSLRMEAVLGA